jgi:hypothetical protein
MDIDVDPDVAHCLKIVTQLHRLPCKRTVLGLDVNSVRSAAFKSQSERTPLTVQVEESSCLGSCKQGTPVNLATKILKEQSLWREWTRPSSTQRYLSNELSPRRRRPYGLVSRVLTSMAEEDEEAKL